MVVWSLERKGGAFHAGHCDCLCTNLAHNKFWTIVGFVLVTHIYKYIRAWVQQSNYWIGVESLRSCPINLKLGSHPTTSFSSFVMIFDSYDLSGILVG